MTREEFKNLDCVSTNEFGYNFYLIEDYDEDRLEYFKDKVLFANIEGVEFHYGMGDDICNSVSVERLELLDKVDENFADWLVSNGGKNDYDE